MTQTAMGKDVNSQDLSKLVSERHRLVVRITECYGEGWKLSRTE